MMAIMKKILVIAFCISFCAARLAAQLQLNEYSAANLKTISDNFGEFEDWIELHNSGTATIDLSGYYLSDDVDEPLKWKFPAASIIKAGAYSLVWCSGRDTMLVQSNLVHWHTNFKITQTKKKAESLILSDAFGKTIDVIKIQKTKPEQSRGRRTESSSEWCIFPKATPRAANVGKFFKSNAEKPEFSLKAGFYKDTQWVSIKTQEPFASIYYTLNGADPTVSNGTKYSAPFKITKTTVLKAVAVSDSASVQESFMEFASYFINDQPSLKVVSITGGTQLEQLANGNKNLLPFGSFEFFDEKGERKASTYGGFNSHGQDSWRNKQRSLDFISRDECGYNNVIKDAMLSLTDRDEFQRIILRAAGDDNYPDGSGTKGGGAHLRDAYLQNLAKKGKLNLDIRTGEKAIVYINGKYWGVYDLREKPNDHDYTDYYYGQGKFDIQYLQTWASTWAEYGGTKALNDWSAFTDYVFENDINDPKVYEQVTKQLDVASLTDYIITNSVSVCSDWVNYNTGWWRGLNPNGSHQKWGYQLWDNDASFGYYINYTGIPDTAATKAKPCDVELLGDTLRVVSQKATIATDTIIINGIQYFPGDTIKPTKYTKKWVDVNGHMKIFNILLKNPTFYQYYITRYTDLMQTTFSKANMLAELDAVYATIKPEMQRHIKRWGGNMPAWENNVAKLRHYIQRRTDYLVDAMKDCYQLSGPYDITFDIEGTNAAVMTINSLSIDKFPYVGQYYGNIATKIAAATAENNTNFTFWKVTSDSVTNHQLATTEFIAKSNNSIIAQFVKGIISSADVVLHPKDEVTAYPTLFEQNIQLKYYLTEPSDLKVKLYDINGREVFEVGGIGGLQAAGAYEMTLQIEQLNLSKGMYFIDFQKNKQNKIIKVIKN
jgi:hypothetical protein